VACACGDVVTSDTTLRPGDPLVSEPCPGDGIVLRARPGAETIVLDLNGLAIHGAGVGVGIRVLDGGRLGASIVGGHGPTPAVVAGFREGVRAGRPGVLASLVGVHVRDSIGHGVVVRSTGARLESIRVEGSGGDGVRAGGRSVELLGVSGQGNEGPNVRDRTRATAVVERAARRAMNARAEAE
jgi:hypothetical protein